MCMIKRDAHPPICTAQRVGEREREGWKERKDGMGMCW